MLNVNQITSTLAKLPDPQLQQYAAMHKNDPYIMALAVAESNRRKEMRGAAQGAQGQGEPPKVADQAIAGMAAHAMPEDQGIARLPAGDMNFADGGIVAFAGSGPTQITGDVQRARDEEAYQILMQEYQRAMGQYSTAQSAGNADAAVRAQSDIAALQRELGRFNKKGIGQAITNALPLPAANAAPQAAPQAPSGDGETAALGTAAGAGAGVLGWLGKNLGIEALTAGFKPGTTAAQAASRIGLGAGAVPAAVVGGGAAASKKAADIVQGMSPEQRSDFYSNPMLGAMSGDTGLAAAIMNAGEGAIKPPAPPMSYGQQMANVGKFFVGHPDVIKPSAPKPPPTQLDNPVAQEAFRRSEIADQNAAALADSLPPDLKKEAIEAGKEATPPKQRKGFTGEDYLMLGLGLLQSKSPRFTQALGEAGLGAMKSRAERMKDEREAESEGIKNKYYEALSKQANAQADYLGAGNKMLPQALKAANDEYDDWFKALGPLGQMQITPAQQQAKRQEFIDKAMAQFRIQGPAAGVTIPQGVTARRVE